MDADQRRERLNAISRRIIGCAFTVANALGSAKALDDVHLAQCLDYPKATGLPLCLLLNFGSPKLEIKRVVNSF